MLFLLMLFLTTTRRAASSITAAAAAAANDNQRHDKARVEPHRSFLDATLRPFLTSSTSSSSDHDNANDRLLVDVGCPRHLGLDIHMLAHERDEGFHPVTLHYFQRTRDSALEISAALHDAGSMQSVDGWLFHESKGGR